MKWRVTDHGDRRHKEFAIMSDEGGEDGTGGKIASVFCGFGSHFSWTEARAHAHIIGAAPEVLEAAEAALPHLEAACQVMGYSKTPILALRAAIDMARGKGK